MSRTIKVAAAQVGAVHRDADREETLDRLLALLQEAASQKVKLVVFPECTLTTFFPRHLFTSDAELNNYFESSDSLTTAPSTAPLFSLAKTSGIDIVLGYAERTPEEGKGYNTSIYYSASADRIISKYRKVHLPGTVEPFEDPAAINQLEKRYFVPGDLGFKAFRAPGLVPDALKKADAPPEQQGVIAEKESQGKGDPILGMLICNDRRWPEAWRMYSLQGAELVVFGYNTGANMSHLWGSKPMSPEEAEKEALFHSRLVQRANSYMNACFSISAARCGSDDGKYDLIAGSSICNPEGHVVAEAKTKGDELVVADIDLRDCRQGKEKTFDYSRHRRIETYGLIDKQTGVIEPELL